MANHFKEFSARIDSLDTQKQFSLIRFRTALRDHSIKYRTASEHRYAPGLGYDEQAEKLRTNITDILDQKYNAQEIDCLSDLKIGKLKLNLYQGPVFYRAPSTSNSPEERWDANFQIPIKEANAILVLTASDRNLEVNRNPAYVSIYRNGYYKNIEDFNVVSSALRYVEDSLIASGLISNSKDKKDTANN